MTTLQIDPEAAVAAARSLTPDDASPGATAPTLAASPAAAAAIVALTHEVSIGLDIARGQSWLAVFELRAAAAESRAADR